MYCRRCGIEIYENDNFCPRCGVSQKEVDSSTNSFEVVLKIFSIIFAIGFFVCFLTDMLNFFLSIVSSFIFLFVGKSALHLAIPYGLCVAAERRMAIVLTLIAFRRTAKNTTSLTFGVVAGGMNLVVLRIILEILLKASGKYVSSSFESSLSIAYVLGVLFCIVTVYLLLFMIGQAPELKTLLKDRPSKISEVRSMTKGFIKKLFNKREPHEIEITSTDNHKTQDDGVVQELTAKEDVRNEDSDISNEHGYSDSKKSIETNRSYVVYLVLSYITGNFYGWYFIYCLSHDVNVMSGGDDKKMMGPLGYALLNLFTCGIYSFYCMYWCANQLASSAPRYGLNFKENGTTMLVRYLVVAIVIGFVVVHADIIEIQSSFTVTNFLVVVTLMNIFGSFVAMYIPLKNTNALAAAYNRL